MQTEAPTYKVSLEELVEQILSSRAITRSEECRLLSALSSETSVNEDLKGAIQRIFYGLRHGMLKVVD